MLNTLRWLLIVPMAIAGWSIAFIAGLKLLGMVYYFCPSDYQVSGMCQHPGAQLLEDFLLVAGAAVSAVFVLVFATVTAPSYKPQVAAATLMLGLAVATWAFLETGALGAFVGACVAGAITFWRLLHHNRQRTIGNQYQYELFI